MAKNCLISIPDYGKATVWVEQVVHGLSIFNLVPTNNQQSRTRRHFFTSHRTSGSFVLTCVFTTHRAEERFTEWLEEYARWAANPNTNSTSARVVVPSRGFDKMGVLAETLSYGDELGKLLRKVEVRFMGGRDPLDLNEFGSLLSVFNAGENDSLARLYPDASGSSVMDSYSWNKVGQVKDAF